MEKLRELVLRAGGWALVGEDHIEIRGPLTPQGPFTFDPAQDHRMAMAAGVLKAAGVELRVLNPRVVNKSYPSFWEDTGLRP